MARRGRIISEVRRGFIEAAVPEQGDQASEIASFFGCHPSNLSRALQKRRRKFEQESRVGHQSECFLFLLLRRLYRVGSSVTVAT